MAHPHEILDLDKNFIIDPITRLITSQSGEKASLMQFDHNSERFTFQIPRYIENHDMLSSDKVQIHYVNTSSGTSVSSRTSNFGIYDVTKDDFKVDPEDENMITASWLISGYATQHAGTLNFLLKFICYGEEEPEYIWNSDLYTGITVKPGLNNNEETTKLYSDIILQLEERVDNLSEMPELVEQLASTVSDRLDKVESQIADILYKPIAISSFTNSVNVAEKGSTVNDVSFTWEFNKTPTTVELGGQTQPTTIRGTASETDMNLTHDLYWILSATDERNATATKSTSITFLNGVYYGVASAPANYDSAFILGLTKTLRSSKLTSINVNAGDGQYIYYCLPKSYGTCAFTVGGFTGGFTLVDTIEFTNASGYEEDYYIYKSDNAGLGSTKVTIA